MRIDCAAIFMIPRLLMVDLTSNGSVSHLSYYLSFAQHITIPEQCQLTLRTKHQILSPTPKYPYRKNQNAGAFIIKSELILHFVNY